MTKQHLMRINRHAVSEFTWHCRFGLRVLWIIGLVEYVDTIADEKAL